MAPEADPLALFFESLRRMNDLGDVSIALPAHGHPFTDLGGRALHIIEHHEERLEVIRRAAHELPNGTVNEYMKILFSERAWGDMAESETYAHLEHLRELGELSRREIDEFAHYVPTDRTERARRRRDRHAPLSRRAGRTAFRPGRRCRRGACHPHRGTRRRR
jgi:glyoxylase-like metal-dependent hydrolase (beta-lactamase superfamily II)